jgi:hypothetical protein
MLMAHSIIKAATCLPARVTVDVTARRAQPTKVHIFDSGILAEQQLGTSQKEGAPSAEGLDISSHPHNMHTTSSSTFFTGLTANTGAAVRPAAVSIP